MPKIITSTGVTPQVWDILPSGNRPWSSHAARPRPGLSPASRRRPPPERRYGTFRRLTMPKAMGLARTRRTVPDCWVELFGGYAILGPETVGLQNSLTPSVIHHPTFAIAPGPQGYLLKRSFPLGEGLAWQGRMVRTLTITPKGRAPTCFSRLYLAIVPGPQGYLSKRAFPLGEAVAGGGYARRCIVCVSC